MNLAKNLIVSTLQLSRPRPPLHKGAAFRVEPDPPKAPNPDPAEAALDPLNALDAPPTTIVAHLPRFDPELAAILRRLVLVLYRLQPRGAAVYPVLAGPTLEGWYHVGSQLPWKQHIGLVCVALGTALSAEDLATACAREMPAADLRATRIDVVVAPAPPAAEGSSATLEAVLPSGRRADRPMVRVRVVFQASAEAAAAAAAPPLRRVTIDGGNCGVFVPRDRADIAKLMMDGEEGAKGGAGGKGAGASGAKVAASPTATLRMPPGWAWCPETQMFVRPVFMRRAMQWPPNVATAKLVGAAVVLLGILYLLTMVMMPECAAMVRPSAARKQASRN
jgi:hypothetical protein